jgi:hypothetical protein
VAGVQHVLSTVVAALHDDPHRTFVYGEVVSAMTRVRPMSVFDTTVFLFCCRTLLPPPASTCNGWIHLQWLDLGPAQSQRHNNATSPQVLVHMDQHRHHHAKYTYAHSHVEICTTDRKQHTTVLPCTLVGAPAAAHTNQGA